MEMEFLRRVTKQIETQLNGLKATEKLVIFLLLVVMGGAIFLMAQYSARREMVPLLNQSFTEAQSARIVGKLDSWQEEYEIRSDRILVPTSRRQALLAKLALAEVLPQDTSAGWSDLLGETDILMPESAREDKRKIIKQLELAGTIAKINGVLKADVFINADNKFMLNRTGPAASASVWVQTSSGAPPKRKLASAIAALVSSANDRMRREDVKIIIDSTLVPVAAEGEELSSEYIERQVEIEKYYRTKILGALPPVDSIRVQVDAKLHNTTTKIHKEAVAEEGQGTGVFTEEQEGSESISKNTRQNREPGLIANASNTTSGAGGETQSQSDEMSTTKKKVVPGITVTETQTPPGGVSKEALTAVVSVPLAYFESYAKKKAGGDKEPDSMAVEAVKAVLIPEFKKIVMGAVGLIEGKHDEQVVVVSYWASGTASSQTLELGGASDGSGASESGLTVVSIGRQYGKHIAVSALAMISLFMVLMMVRKASGPIDISEDEAVAMMAGQRPLDALGVDETNIVDGEDPGGLLAGMELDDRTVRSQQVLEQIRDMIKEEPDIAATLIKKWMK